MRKSVRSLMLGVVAATLAVALSASADPITLFFSPIPFDTQSPVPSAQDQLDLQALGGQMSVTVDYVTAPAFVELIDPAYDYMISFTFSNVGSIGSNIGEIYWDWAGSLLDPTVPAPGGFYDDPSGETWLLAAPPAPGGVVKPNDFPPPSLSFVPEAGADGGNGGEAGLSNTDPEATFYIGLGTGTDWNGILAALQDPDGPGLPGLRMGVHVRSIATYGGDSYRFISDPYIPGPGPRDDVVVPVPAAAGLGMLGMAIVGMLRRKRSGVRA